MRIGGQESVANCPTAPRSIYFQARPAGFETDDRLTVIAPNVTPKHYWVDQVHAGFEHVVLKYNNTGNQLWVESDGKVGASIDLTTNDFRAEGDPQHEWAKFGTAQRSTQGILSVLSRYSARGRQHPYTGLGVMLKNCRILKEIGTSSVFWPERISTHSRIANLPQRPNHRPWPPSNREAEMGGFSFRGKTNVFLTGNSAD